MSCELFQQTILDFDWGAASRQRAAEALDHVRACPECQRRLGDYDRITAALSFPDIAAAEPPSGWAMFQRRLAATGPREAWRRLPMWLRPAGAVAASLTLAAGAFTAGRFVARPAAAPVAVHTAPRTAAEDGAPFAPHQVNHEVQAFDQVSKVFDGRASWMLVSNGASDVGVAKQSLAAEARNVLLLRLTMTRGGQVASDVDLLVVPGQTANLTVPLNGAGAGSNPSGHSLHYRIGTSADEPTRLAVWLDINTPQGGQPLAALATNLQVEPGRKVTAGQLATSAGDYELTIGFVRARMPEAKP